MIRVIAGKYKGARLQAPKIRGVRPTSGRVKESLFSILRGKLEGAAALDLFAGSGALGIEALSRGAQSCVFVDADKRACAAIRQNLAAVNAPREAAQIVCADANRAAARLRRERRAFQLLFLDPPYDSPELPRTLQTLGETSPIYAEDGVAAAEHGAKTRVENRYGNLIRTRLETYGDTQLSFYSIRRNIHGDPEPL